jgi:serine/threonine-protein kinase RsbW
MLMDTTYAPDLAAGRALRADLTATLALLEIGEQRANDLLLVLSELFTNIVRHGTPAPTRIRVTLRQGDGALTVALEDDGGHFDGFQSALCAASDPAISPLTEGGMGLGLIANLVGSVHYARQDGVNRLSFDEPLAVRRRPTVALIDDDPVPRTIAASFLDAGYQVNQFGDAEDALTSIRINPPDLIISDIAMPGMDGLELRRRLQDDDRTALIPFVFLTGLNDESLEERASTLEIDDFLEKPVSKTRLRNAADRVLRRSRGLREMLQSSVDRRITDALRSPLPSRAGPWAISALEQSATPGGGDLVLHRRGPDWTTVLVLDVMGHGVTAKIFAFAYAGYVQSLLADDATARRPEALIDALSARIAVDDRLAETIVTCAAVHLDDGGTGTVAVGGHPRPLIHRSGLSWRPVPVSGGMPGLCREPRQPRAISMEPGDALMIVTDGLGEALSFEHPETALLRALETAGPVDGALLTRLDQLTHSGGDDRTAVLLRYAPDETQP